MSDETVFPTYEQLRAERAREWSQTQARAAKALAELHASIRQEPDVRNPPDPSVPWCHRGIACGCGGTAFYCQRWVTVNGLRHRAELACCHCERVNTWDWGSATWL